MAKTSRVVMVVVHPQAIAEDITAEQLAARPKQPRAAIAEDMTAEQLAARPKQPNQAAQIRPCVLGSGVLVAAPRALTQRVCARVPPFRALVPLAGALFDMSLPFYYRVAACEQFTNGTREPSRARARRQAHARRAA